MKLQIIRSAQKDLDKLSDDTTLRISKKLYELAINPYPFGSEKLAGKKGYRIRIGDYRVIYEINKELKEVIIVKIKHRKEVYK